MKPNKKDLPHEHDAENDLVPWSKMIGETIILKLVSYKDLIRWNHWNKDWGKWCQLLVRNWRIFLTCFFQIQAKKHFDFFLRKGARKHRCTYNIIQQQQKSHQSTNQWSDQSMNQPVQPIQLIQWIHRCKLPYRCSCSVPNPIFQAPQNTGALLWIEGRCGDFMWNFLSLGPNQLSSIDMPFSARHGQLMVAIFCQDRTQNFQPTSLF